jgi:hypothetical protein
MKNHLILLRNIRMALLKEIEGLTLEELNHIPSTHRNNIIWNVGHCLVIQQLLCYSLSSVYCRVEKDILVKYKNGSVPDGKVTQEEVDFVKKMLLESVDLLEQDLENSYFKEYKEYTVGFKTVLTSVEDAITFNNAHEGLHYGYILSLKKLL